MNKRVRCLLFILLAAGQLFIARYRAALGIQVDLLYLILFFVSIRSSFLPSVVSAAFIGLGTDYLSGGVIGVFSFSRTLAAYFLNTIARFLDLKKNIFVFLLIFFSLFLANLVAFVFHVLIFGLKITASLLLFQPLFTAVVGTVILGSEKMKTLMDVS
ncbi:MAG: rod shape-determining protein MreD [Candidatus Aminicenantes bacterium]|nr:rod shape-determining protein MreD [Candidatus Aminicenantes bacterium]